MRVSIYTDGAARGNPGPAAYAFIVTNEEGQMVSRKGGKLGVATNNQAEYRAVLESLKFVGSHLPPEPMQLDVFMDSKLVVQQLAGIYKIKNPILKGMAAQIKVEEQRFNLIRYHHIPREKNKEADKLANQVLDNLL